MKTASYFDQSVMVALLLDKIHYYRVLQRQFINLLMKYNSIIKHIIRVKLKLITFNVKMRATKMGFKI